MIWLTWRQQRLEILLTTGLLAAIALFLVLTGLSMQHTFHALGVGACLGPNPGQNCSGVIQTFQSDVGSISGIAGWLNFLPLILGLLLAAPFVLELEQGSFRLAWTQSITRSQWLIVKLCVVGLLTILAAFVLAELLSFWRMPLDRIGGSFGPNESFDLEGIVPIAYGLFAVALGLAAGALFRKTIPAAVIAIVTYVPVRLSVQNFLRPNYMAPVKLLVPLTSSRGPKSGDWVLTSTFADRFGHILSNSSPIYMDCASLAKLSWLACMTLHHVLSYAVYQPASRFWAFQGIEAGIFAGAALLLFAFTFWQVRTRLP